MDNMAQPSVYMDDVFVGTVCYRVKKANCPTIIRRFWVNPAGGYIYETSFKSELSCGFPICLGLLQTGHKMSCTSEGLLDMIAAEVRTIERTERLGMTRIRNAPSATAVPSRDRQAARRARGARTVSLPASALAQLDCVATYAGDSSRAACIVRIVQEYYAQQPHQGAPTP